MAYKHGAYGSLEESVVQRVVESATVPVYFGTAPVGLVRGYEDADVINAPVRISSLADARAKIGHSTDFGAYTLCEAVAAHFDNGGEGVGPIYVVNVLDPSRHVKPEPATRSVTVAGGRAEVATDSAVLDTLVVNRPPVEGAAQTSHAHPAHAELLRRAGVTYADGLITYEPTGDIDPALFHGDVPYVGIVFDAPEGATAAHMTINGGSDEDFDLVGGGEFVVGGDPVHWFGFAEADGSPRTPTAWEVRFTWAGGEADGTETACRVCRYQAGYVEGVDYRLDYNANAGKVVISAVEGGDLADGATTVTYEEMDPDAVTADDVIGMVTADGEYSGIQALALLWQEQFVVPNILAAPGWSQAPEVYKALVSASQSINGHWDAVVAADLPLVDPADGSTMVDTIDKALEWKEAHGYSSERCVACWPMAEDADGRSFHVSTLFVAASQRVDQSHDGVPFETPSNKAVPVVRQFFGDNARNRGFDQQTANSLNAKGVTTVIGWAGEWVLWGPHTAAYDDDNPSVDPRAYFATNVRMLLHITNEFQLRWGPEIDSPMTRALKDRIVNAEQEQLDRLVTMGALIGEPRIEFLAEENPTSQLMRGDFVWSAEATPTPPLKSATVGVHYTDAGFAAYFDEDGE